ncbi:VOC family protein [Acinetobacter qingfengensis]|uniref:Bleomycin resistance protein n=1 Tax=Acinetobacter qingfengensis TaxID=1262585 RepID=A0A1E7RFX3_9GAMM|nr:VOC family protein [Acinetobacter qingfengensis]KAA8732760.1 VOC family protein [Acinetobacter qingfengensis]OEY98127.1 bleomycin resistance protein [Acinetobacter qingfengensis]
MLEDAIFNKVTINYIEFNVRDIEKTKTFYTHLGWSFTDYSKDYCEFDSGSLKGGFTQNDDITTQGGALIILYTAQLEQTLEIIKLAGGRIIKNIFDFPGGRRFHFTDPDGYELAIWSDH